MIQNKEELIRNHIDKYKEGKQSAPKLELDIYIISPKIIVHEAIMSPHLVDMDPQAIVIDLGRIDIRTNLLKKEQGADYTKERDALKLYDTMTIKFGKLKITADY